MKELNELIDRYDVSCHCGAVYVRPKQDGHLVMYSDYASLAQRAETAEAKLALVREQRDSELNRNTELEAKLTEQQRQGPVAFTSPFYWKELNESGRVNCWLRNDRRDPDFNVELFARPAPAASLSELVPEDYFASLVSKARNSADKAITKFPQPNYVLLKVAEEAGEVVQAGVHYAENRMTWQEVESEVVQLMAMLIRLVTEGDQVNGITPPEACRAAILRNIEEQSQ